MFDFSGRRPLLGAALVVSIFAACSGKGVVPSGDLPSTMAGRGGGVGSGATGGMAGTGSMGAGTGGSGVSLAGTTSIDVDASPGCSATQTCAELGWQCGSFVDECNVVHDCADEGLSCGPLEICVGGVDDMPTQCVTGGEPCDICDGIPDCSMAGQETALKGRVVSPGRDDANVANQVGVPNAIVYILRNNNEADLPPITSGIPAGGTSCDRCEEQEVGPVLAGAVTDAIGNFTLEGNIPVGVEMLLVVKAGRFRRATKFTLPEEAACTTTMLPTTLPENPTRLPRNMTDGIGVNIPRIAVTTGELDAMECVLEKMGISHNEFSNPGDAGGSAARVHLYRGGLITMGTPTGSGARIDDSTPHDATLYGSLERLQGYDIVVADCEGASWDEGFPERDAHGARVREYVNRGGRLFASHLGFSWLHENGDTPYSDAAPFETGLAAAGTWSPGADTRGEDMDTGWVSLMRPNASPRIQAFADWLVNEGVTTAPDYGFTILDPRTQNESLGPSSEEFVYRERPPAMAPGGPGGPGGPLGGMGGMSSGGASGSSSGGQSGSGSGGTAPELNVQQFSFNTPYGAPAEAACGRVAYSSFHVSVGNTADATFPQHCDGDLSAQEKILLYMLFDLGACVGEEPPPPECNPGTCESIGADCGFVGDGCGAVIDCGPCNEPPTR